MPPSIVPAVCRTIILVAGIAGVKVSPQQSADIMELCGIAAVAVEGIGHWWERRRAAKAASAV